MTRKCSLFDSFICSLFSFLLITTEEQTLITYRESRHGAKLDSYCRSRSFSSPSWLDLCISWSSAPVLNSLLNREIYLIVMNRDGKWYRLLFYTGYLNLLSQVKGIQVLFGFFLNWTPVFDWCMVRLGSKKKHHKDTRLEEIELHLQILLTAKHSMVNTIGRTYFLC